MDATIGHLEVADVLVVGDKIAAVGVNLQADADLIIDGKGKVVLPGFIDTHTHMWNALWRNLELDYLTLTEKVSPHYRPEDSYNAVRMCALEMLNSGITTAHAWEHNVLSPLHADAELQALTDLGIRARYSYGYHHHLPNEQIADLPDILRARREWASDLITVGYASRVNDNDGTGPCGWPSAIAEVREKEWEFARREQLPITHHVTYLTSQPDAYYEVAGPDLLMIHGYHWGEEVWRRLADQGVAMSMSPYTSIWYKSLPPFKAMASAGVITSLSFDSVKISGAADNFRSMLIAKLMDNFSGGEITNKDLLHAATLGGAKALGIDGITGSVTPGKRADLMVVDMRALNMSPRGSVEQALIHSAGPQNVEYVTVDGKFAKFEGQLLVADPEQVVHQAEASLSHLLQASGL
ncbi:amidohydrolase family protein [Microvirga alba]|uniref:Amidohydrolase family protein n=1 Tax=Microvirga alba TaxID=2791025 RepID=A0A931FTP2_9HYPH|nr:amidohydrolase family protein [Microvirga alba]MBF9234861.1 amidohydrolase family protein [Microvirga alba]